MLPRFNNQDKGGYVYIVSNKLRTVLYIGVTADLQQRMQQHASGDGSNFTSQYQCTDLVYYEVHRDMVQAIAREKQLKRWKRTWKEALIRSVNPEMDAIGLLA